MKYDKLKYNNNTMITHIKIFQSGDRDRYPNVKRRHEITMEAADWKLFCYQG